MLDAHLKRHRPSPADASIGDATALLIRNGLALIESEVRPGPAGPVGLAGLVTDPIDDLVSIESRRTNNSSAPAGLHHRLDDLERRLRETERELQRMRHRLALAEIAANTDALTGIPNRRHFEEVLAAAIAVVRQLRQPLSLLMIDVDHFKGFNDEFGHPIGDHVLRFVAGVVTHPWQTDTFAARYGGEEFAMLCLRTTRQDALQRAESIRARLARHKMIIRGTGERLRSVTVSIGVAELGQREHPDDLIRRADAALYRAKRSGRDRVVADQP